MFISVSEFKVTDFILAREGTACVNDRFEPSPASGVDSAHYLALFDAEKDADIAAPAGMKLQERNAFNHDFEAHNRISIRKTRLYQMALGDGTITPTMDVGAQLKALFLYTPEEMEEMLVPEYQHIVGPIPLALAGERLRDKRSPLSSKVKISEQRRWPRKKNLEERDSVDDQVRDRRKTPEKDNGGGLEMKFRH
ncbi:hypothetical protein R3P38DRAFT_3197436 [Favolaschia claudopus]|uniref:Uncharacterized protein n=1 Tax=Favolaschia claudopus TaxID=2862362 RepID=A0AAW0B542_9AGAR